MTFGGKGNFAKTGSTDVSGARHQIDLCLWRWSFPLGLDWRLPSLLQSWQKPGSLGVTTVGLLAADRCNPTPAMPDA